jgi:Tfp pilus assembly protein PilV
MLVEVVIAMLLVSIAVLALGVMMVRISRTASGSANAVYTAAAASAEASRIAALPYDSLASLAPGCVTVSTAPQPYQRCTVVNNVSSRVQSVRIVVTPSGNTLLRPDTVTIVRTRTGGTGASSGTFP